MSPNFFRPAAASPFRFLQARSAFFTLAAVVLFAVPQLLAGHPAASASIVAPSRQRIAVSATLPAGTSGVAYNAVLSVSGGEAPYKFQGNNLPSGLMLNGQTGGISGTPETAGAFSFAIWVTDTQGDRGLGTVSLTIASKSSVVISISPASISVNSGTKVQFSATVSNSSNTSATWTASQGTVSSSGLFAAPTVTADTSVVVTAKSVADSTKSAAAVVSVSPSSSVKVSLEVLFPPTNPNTSDFKAVQQYLMSNPVVSGGNLTVEWGMIDQGPTTNLQYDWSSIDSEIVPWVAAGKKVNLIVWANSDNTVATCTDGTTSTTGNCAIPAYVWKSLGSANYTSCVTQYGTQQIPNYLDRASFQIPYQSFMAAVIQKYGSNLNIGYIRFGLGHGGETYPATGWNTATAACGQAFAAWGVTVTTWESYLASMLNYEASLRATKQLMVGVTPMGAPNTLVPDYVAPLSVPMNIGFGSQGLQQSDITNYPNCTANWCNLFAQFTGQAPLELQTYLLSCPDNSCTTGSLVNLVPFAVSHHATVLEIYYQDWLVAFDPLYPGNSQYGASYAKVLTNAASTTIQ